MDLINEDEDNYKKTILKYRKLVLEESVILCLLFKALQEFKKKKETTKDVSELCELKRQIDLVSMLARQGTKEISNLTHKWSFYIQTKYLFDKAKRTKGVLSFMDDNDRIREICETIFSLFEETPELLNKIKVKEFLTYLGEYFEKPEESMSPEGYLKTLLNN